MNWIKVSTGAFHKTLKVPYSKSYLNRLLILASLKEGVKTIQNFSPSQDVLDMMTALKQVGLEIEQKGSSLIISNSFPACEKEGLIEVMLGEGGTTARFLLSFLSRGKGKYYLTAKGRLNDRPFRALILTLKNLGLKVSHEGSDFFPLTLQGPVEIPKVLTVEANETTQFVSSLMLAFAEHRIHFKYEATQSAHYIELTKKLIEESYRGHFSAEPDFSSAAYPLCLGLIGGEVTLSNILGPDLLQADHYLLTLFERSKVIYHFSSSGLHLKQQSYPGFDLDVSHCLDLVPALCFLASYAKTSSFLRSVSKLSNKESDRLEELKKLLTEFSVKYDYDTKNDQLIIQGNSPKVSVKKIITAPDHRMVMTAYLFLRHNSGGELAHAECVNKSFPEFFELMQ